MAEATITLKLSPTEFDLVREAITGAISQAENLRKDAALSAATRQKQRLKSLLLQDVNKRLGSA